MRWLLVLALVLAVAAGALVAVTPALEAEGYHLPWSGPPKPVYSLWQSPAKVGQGEMFSIVVTSTLKKPLQQVTGKVTGLYGVEKLTFFNLDGRFTAVVPVSYSNQPGDYAYELYLIDPRKREHVVTGMVTVERRRFPTENLVMGPAQTDLISDQKLNDDDKKVAQAKAGPTPRALWQGHFLRPVDGPISTEYGTIRSVNGAPFGWHSGLDIEAPSGKPVVASNAGRVTFAGVLNATGNTVIIDHGLGLYTAYNHLSKMSVKVGQMVAAGEKVGEVGSTGFSTGPHLHFTMTVGTIPTNPWPWFAADPVVLLTPPASSAPSPSGK